MNEVARSAASAPPLRESDVHVWRARLGVDSPAEMGIRAFLCAEERERAGRFRQTGDRRRFEVGRGLLRALVGKYTGSDPRAVRFREGPHGKPGVATEDGGRDIGFNVSHSGDIVLVALASGRRLGVDVERLDRRVAVDSIASRFFAIPEVARLHALPPARRTEMFLRLWVMKEAFTKGIGVGIGGVDLRGFAVDPEATEGTRIEALTHAAREAISDWSVTTVPANGAYVAALAFEGSAMRLQVLDWPAPTRAPGTAGF